MIERIAIAIAVTLLVAVPPLAILVVLTIVGFPIRGSSR
jgi:hypothetical protein